jgi:serine/threonine protein kinase
MLEPPREDQLGGFDNDQNCEALKKPTTTKFTEDESKYIFMQLLDVIDYLSCEEIGICHRDINPNNLMLDDITEVAKELQVENRCSDFEDNDKEANEIKKYVYGEPTGDGDNQITTQVDQINDLSSSLEKLEKKGPNFRKFKLTLIDFNVAKRFLDLENGNPLLMMTNTGTARYQAPEMLGGWMSRYD